jgi:lipopolysaccharide transport system permease protein
MADPVPVVNADVLSTGTPGLPAAAAATVREHQPKVLEMVLETWRYRGLIVPLGLRQVIKGYSGTRIGRPWLVIRPLFSVFGMALIFGSVLRAPSNGVPYLLFLLVGMVGWVVIERTVFWATRSFDSYRKIVGRLGVPVLLAPAAGVAPMLVDAGIMASIGVGVAAYYTITTGELAVQLGPSLLLSLGGLGLGLGLAFGIGLWLATLNALARDVRLVLRFVLPLWMYVTPVLYPADTLPDRWRFLATINPAAAPVELVKQGVLGVGSVSMTQLAVSLVATLLILGSGLWFTTRLSPTLLRAAPFVDDEEEEERL